jgi:hypothetical protein
MKKAAIAVGMLLVLVVLTYFVAIAMASSGRDTIAAEWRTLESDEAFAAKFPPVREKNDVAARLEAAAIPLGIGLMAKPEMDRLEPGTIDSKPFGEFRSAADVWLKGVIESPEDAIAAPPEAVTRYLAGHSATIDEVLAILDAGGAPLWPVVNEGAASLRPLPNLLGQMNLSRILSAASLEAERSGDRERAWRCQRATWTVAKGTLSRPEMISQLVGVAMSRSVAGVSRKLDGPAPAWFRELEMFDFQRAMLDSCRAEWLASEQAMSGDQFIEDLRASARSENGSLGEVARDVAMRPFILWGTTEMERVTVEELLKIEQAEPCDIDSKAISAAIESKVSPVAKRLAGDFLPSTHTAFARVANARIAIEGTAKIVALKGRRSETPEHSWPVGAADLTPSHCSGARWRYERSEDGSIRFAFDGKVDVPPGFRGYRIPNEFVGR